MGAGSTPFVQALLAIDDVRVLVVDDASPDGTADAAAAIAAATGERVAVRRRTGPRGLGRSYVDGIVSDGYAFQVEMTWEAHAAGGRVVEVPITFVERRIGRSKLSGRVIGASIVLPWRLAARPRAGR